MLITFLAFVSLLPGFMPLSVRLAAVVVAGIMIWVLFRAPYSEQQLLSLQQTVTEWRLQLSNQEWLLATLDGPVRDWHYVIFLCFLEQDPLPGSKPRRWRLMLWHDQFDPQDWRRLRVSLRWRHQSAQVRALDRSRH